ncbi:Cell division cycle protein 123-like [Cricetulus griseus]|uniref:Translation initiation factor eIF2 assembly protein n=1 Tax=Cricetulus griseus TaxID=10029 RepID=G3GVP9_CRIGR|nr:Cell division cycle protein 123-like [Cricetulus griseus]
MTPYFGIYLFSSVILPLPQNVKDYLLDDGTLVVSGREDPPTSSQPDSDNEAEETQWSDDESTATLTAPEFPEFTTQVQEAINSLGGSVFPKLNWSAPRDAYWIAMNSSLKCKTLSDIFLLFKSSDFITRDFTQPFIHCTDDSPDPSIEYELVLRKWCELIPGAEFRCFVKENKLIGEFFLSLKGKVWLIDFNPFGEVTDSLLFTWEDLTSENNLRGDFGEGASQGQDSPAFRCTNSEVTVQPSPYLSYRLPKDFVDLSTGEDVHKLIDFLKLKKLLLLLLLASIDGCYTSARGCIDTLGNFAKTNFDGVFNTYICLIPATGKRVCSPSLLMRNHCHLVKTHTRVSIKGTQAPAVATT